MFIYTHRGSKEHIQKCLNTKCIKAYYPDKGFLSDLLLDHNKACVWVSTGYPTKWNYIWSGMLQYQLTNEPRKYYITFSSLHKAKCPSGLLKKPFYSSQRVFEYDIVLEEKNILSYYDGISQV